MCPRNFIILVLAKRNNGLSLILVDRKLNSDLCGNDYGYVKHWFDRALQLDEMIMKKHVNQHLRRTYVHQMNKNL